MDNACQNNPDVIRFRATTDDESISEIIAHNQLLDKIECDDGENKEWRFKAIVDHQGPLTSNHKEYKGSRWNVQIHWENGEISWEPLSIIIKSDPVTCAIYDKDNDLLDLEGWKRLKRLANCQKKLLQMANQAKLKLYQTSPVYKFRVLIPRNHDQAMEIDGSNGNSLWREAEVREMNQVDEYKAFIDNGFKRPKGYKQIRVHFVYYVKPTLV